MAKINLESSGRSSGSWVRVVVYATIDDGGDGAFMDDLFGQVGSLGLSKKAQLSDYLSSSGELPVSIYRRLTSTKGQLRGRSFRQMPSIYVDQLANLVDEGLESPKDCSCGSPPCTNGGRLTTGVSYCNLNVKFDPTQMAT